MTDYMFIDKNGQLIETGAFEPTEAQVRAQQLARLYATNIIYGVVVSYTVKPDKCPDCGQLLSPTGHCPDCQFDEMISELWSE